jgi:hypothetical protein
MNTVDYRVMLYCLLNFLLFGREALVAYVA